MSAKNSDQVLMTVRLRQAGACDIVGDVHGQAKALFSLLALAGWQIEKHDPRGLLPIRAFHPAGRILVFTGDLVNKGPDSIRVLRLAMGLRQAGLGYCVLGNHDAMLLAALSGQTRGMPQSALRTAKDILARGRIFAARVQAFLESLPCQIRLPMPADHPMSGDGWLTIVHASCPERHLDRATRKAQHRCVWGFSKEEEARRTKGRRGWAKRYAGARWVVHGHTPVHGLRRTGRVICLDTGASSDGHLTLFRPDLGQVFSQPIFLAGGGPKDRKKALKGPEASGRPLASGLLEGDFAMAVPAPIFRETGTLRESRP